MQGMSGQMGFRIIRAPDQNSQRTLWTRQKTFLTPRDIFLYLLVKYPMRPGELDSFRNLIHDITHHIQYIHVW